MTLTAIALVRGRVRVLGTHTAARPASTHGNRFASMARNTTPRLRRWSTA